METDRPDTNRPLVRYILFQIPALVIVAAVLLALREWADLADWLVWAVIAGWVAKDVALYPFVRKAYDDRQVGYSYSLEGAQGVAHTRLDPRGIVRVRSELWKAEVAEGAIDAGAKVRVVEVRGMSLLVEEFRQP